MKLAALAEEFPADTTKTTPAATALQMASCSGSLLLKPQFPSSEPEPPRLMLATSITPALAVR